LAYDVQCQIEALQVIKAGLNASNIDALQYFVREYCRTDEIPTGFDDLKARHSNLCNEIEGFDL
jgi:hypothetical protein